jgi:hypothetical protein
MYRIVGADGKEYGPISADQLRQWIAEGRANAQTRVLLEGTAEWRMLGEVPEFAANFAGPAPAYTPGPVPSAFPSGGAPDAADRVNGPAIGLIVVAIVSLVAQILGLIWNLVFASMASRQTAQPPWGNYFSGTFAIIGAVIGIATSGIILFGGLKMKKLENYGLAMAASIIAMIPCFTGICCLAGLPIGIWALTVITKPEIKSAFH